MQSSQANYQRTGSEIRGIVEDLYGQFGYIGIGRRYDIVLTDRGIVFAVVVGALKANLMAGLRGGLASGGGTGGASASGGLSVIEEGMAKKGSDAVAAAKTLGELLSLDKNNKFVPYDAVKSVSVKKGLVSGKMTIELMDGKFYANLANERVDGIIQTLRAELSSKMR